MGGVLIERVSMRTTELKSLINTLGRKNARYDNSIQTSRLNGSLHFTDRFRICFGLVDAN